MNKKHIEEILKKLAKDEATAGEKQAFTIWLSTLNEKSYCKILNQYQIIVRQIPGAERDMPELKRKIESRLEGQGSQQRFFTLKTLRDVAAVAIILLVAVAGSWYFMNILLGTAGHLDNKIQITSRYGDDILPGGDKATLTLSGGERIILDDIPEGELKVENGIRIEKTGDGEIVYDFSTAEMEKSAPVAFNTISTPKGGEYRVTLPDGSRVWLNSESSITCPTEFSGKERIVEVRGEVYFEVTKMVSPDHARRVPFIVRMGDQSVEVLGTQFNIKAYPDMERMETTLVEGQVRVHTPLNKVLLAPGEQAKVKRNGDMEVIDDVDIDKIVAWKNGYFQFSDDSIGDIMQQLGRWYDVEVQYKGSASKAGFGGQISRSKNISEVLQILELTGEVHFRIDGRTIQVFGK